MASLVLTAATQGGTTAITPTDQSGTITCTLPSTGGTLQTSGSGFTTNGVAYASSTSALTTGSALTFNGTALVAAGGIFKANGSPSLSAATAGEAILAPEPSLGALLYGRGTSYDVTIGQRGTNVALAVPTGTSTVYIPNSLGIGTTTGNNPLVIATTGISGTYAHFNGGNNTEGGANPWLATLNNSSVSSATYGWGLYNSSTDGNLKTYVWNGSTTPTLVQSFNRTYGGVTFGSGQSTVGNFNLYTDANTKNVFYMVKNGQVEMTMGFKTSTDSNFYVGSGSPTIGTYGVYLTNGGTSWNSVSDERYKENLVPITDAITKVNSLRAVTGNFITDENKTKRPFLIAQDVLAVLPEAVDTSDSEKYGLAYTDVIPLLVASIKELSTLITAQSATIQSLTESITALEGART